MYFFCVMSFFFCNALFYNFIYLLFLFIFTTHVTFFTYVGHYSYFRTHPDVCFLNHFYLFFHLIQQNSVLSRSFPIIKGETIIWCCTKLRKILHVVGVLPEYAHTKRKISTYVDIWDKWDSFWCAFRVMWQKIARLLGGLRESNNWWL